MQPHDLISLLVDRAGGTARVARDMRTPGFQGTLHKICAGHVRSPKRESAQRIADYFGIPIDAIYDAAAASRAADELGVRGLVVAREPAVAYETVRDHPTAAAVPDRPYRRELDAMSRVLRHVPAELRRPLGAMLDSWAQAGGTQELRDAIEHLLRAAAAIPREQGETSHGPQHRPS